MKENIDRRDEEKYKEEIRLNDEKAKKSYQVVDELFENLVSEVNPKFKAIIQDKIDNNRKNIEILENRNLELWQLLRNQEELNRSLEEVINYIEDIKEKDVYRLTREQQITFVNNTIKSIFINKDSVDVIFKFSKDDNG